MANYRKSFNFRTGLQVDNDNFVVNANGLVGIGTSIPENYLLNVYGDTRVTGVVTTGSLNAGVGTVTTLTATNSSLGVATVTSIQIAGGPVITDLVGYAYSTFTNDGVGGISTTSRIGIGTTADSTDRLKVLGDTNLSGDLNVSNSTISMSGGIVTATTFVGNVTGTATTANNLSDGANITTGTISDARLPDLITSNINISSGISTFNDIKVGSAVTIGSSGIVTATTFVGNVTGTATTATNLENATNITTGTIDAARLSGTYNINVNASSGISTFVDIKVGSAVTVDSSGINTPSGIITASSFVGDVTGTATTANNLSDGANITTGTISDDRLPDLITSNINISSGISTVDALVVGSAVTINSTGINAVSGIFTATTFIGNVTGTATTATALSGTPDITVGQVTSSNLSASGIVTATTELNVGSDGTALTALSTGRLGIGTAVPTSELLIRKSSGSLLEVISDSGQARISIGNSVGVGNSSGVLRFGNTQRTLDFINRDTGNINMILHGGGSGIDTGRFDWIYGQNNDELMSLTYGGSLGIGITNPSNTLHVVGTSTVTGNAFVGGNLSVDGNISGTITLPSLITSNIDVSSGISTFFELDIDNGAEITGNIVVSAASSIGIGTDAPITDVDAFNKILVIGAIGVGQSFASINNKLPDTGSIFVDGQVISDNVGIGTTLAQQRLSVYGNVELYPEVNGPPTATSYVRGTKIEVVFDNQSAIGIGTTSAAASIDFSLAGKNLGGGASSFMLPPQVSTTVGLDTAGKEGALVFNTTTKKFQGYTGTTWVDLH